MEVYQVLFFVFGEECVIELHWDNRDRTISRLKVINAPYKIDNKTMRQIERLQDEIDEDERFWKLFVGKSHQKIYAMFPDSCLTYRHFRKLLRDQSVTG